MSKIMVALIDIENKEGYKGYQDEVLPMFEDLGIDVLAVDDVPKAIEGTGGKYDEIPIFLARFITG